MKEKTRGKFDYKWIIIGLCFLMIMFSLGWASSSRSIFIKPQTERLGIARSLYSIGDSLRFISTAVVNLFFGFLIAKFGAKKLILAGLVALISAILCYAFATNLLLIYIGGTLLGIGFSWTSTTIVGYVVNVWSKKNKGTIMGLILCSNGIGGAIAVNILNPIISASLDGYKTAYLIVASVVALIFILMLFFFKNRPSIVEEEEDLGEKSKRRGSDWVGLDIKETVKRPFFYFALVAIFLTGVVLQGVTGVFTPLMSDNGISPNIVSIVLTVSMIALAGFKFVSGILYDKCGLRTTVTLSCVASMIIMFTYAFTNATPLGIVLAFVSAILGSVALPLETIMLPIYALDLFGQKSYNQHLGIIVSVNTAGYAVGAPLMNLVYDLTGNYIIGLVIAGCLMAIVIIILQYVITISNRERRKQLVLEN